MTTQIEALVLAAGKGTRMKSNLPKVIHTILEKPMVSYVVEALKTIDCKKITLVTGYKSELVKSALSHDALNFVEQTEQLGTGHAVQCYIKSLKTLSQHLMVVCGDTPLISVETLKKMVEQHTKHQPAITMMTLQMETPGNYGRILRDNNGNVTAIREAKDCSAQELLTKEVNLAVYIFDKDFIMNNIFSITANNRQSEYYLTDLVEMAVNQNKKVITVIEKDESSTLGINSRQHLAEVSHILQNQILNKLMDSGVTITNPENTLISSDVVIAPDTIIHPGCMITGKSHIGENCIIGPNAHIINSEIGNDCKLETCVIENAKIKSHSLVEPFSHIKA